ncbi:Pectin lyase-like superfamily protein [Perilla frutescens var. hirtella]|nr:Pectin lyase-like superfamily protein [Perilla frutescens var. hirtella]
MKKMSYIIVETLLVFILFFLPIVRSTDNAKLAIPAEKAKLASWFDSTFGAASTVKTASLKPVALSGAAAATGKAGPPKLITVKKDGSGNFKTLTDAIKSIPSGNKQRVIVSIGPGNYTEKVTIPRDKPFITLYGDPKNMPVFVYGGTAAKYGTVDSATLSAESDNFTCVNVKVVNCAPRPDGKIVGAQAAAVRVGGDSAVFYNCKFYGYQDTVFDYKGRHLFKDCYIEGTVDFIFGSAKSVYLNTEIHVIPGDPMSIIAAHAREKDAEDTGFIFVHCSVTGTGRTAVLGRSWFPYPRVVYAFCDLSDVVKPEGWSNNFHPETNSTVFFGEYNNRGPGSNLENRVKFAKKLSPNEAKPFTNLGYIDAASWLGPPIKL